MKRIALLLLLGLAGLSGCREARTPLPMAVAHRGCWLKDGEEFYINENCPAGVRMAAQYGYPAIECDVRYTRDSVMVLMHDGTINRTMRLAADYSPIPEPVRVSELDFEELRSRYVLASTDPALRLPIPTLEEELLACKEYGIVPMLHSSVVESYRLAQQILGDGFIAFDASQKALAHARDYSAGCLILLDPDKDSAEATISRLASFGGPAGMSTMKYQMLDAAYIRAVKDAGYQVQASIFPAPHEQRALMDGVTIELSDFYWHQTAGRKPVCTLGKKKFVMEEGSALEWKPETAPEYAAITLELAFEGTLEISLCGRTYTLEGSGRSEIFGLRLYKTAPTLSIRALSQAKLHRCRAAVWDLG